MIESPSGRMLKKAPRWDLMGTEGCDGGKVFSWMLLVVWNICEYIGGRARSGGHRGAHKVGVPPLGRALHPCRCLVALLTWTSSPLGVFWSKKNHREVLFRLDSI